MLSDLVLDEMTDVILSEEKMSIYHFAATAGVGCPGESCSGWCN